MNKANVTKVLLLSALTLVLMVVLVVGACAKAPAPPPKPVFKMPDPLICTSLDVAGAGYAMYGAIADALRKETGMVMRVVPCGTVTGRMSLMLTGRAHFTGLSYSAEHMAQEGEAEFGTADWGPQPVRLVWAGMPATGMQTCTAKDAGIRTWADAKGKRAAWIPGHPSANQVIEACLAFGGLTWADVKKVEFPSFAGAGKGVVEGKADMACCATSSTFVYDLESSPRGLQWVPMPHADEAGWKRTKSVLPIMEKAIATKGAGVSEAKPLETATYPNPAPMVLDWAEPELVYQLAKLHRELYPIYGLAPIAGIEQFAPERAVYKAVVPYHEGAIRYYKETGVWTAEHQKNNDLMVERQRVLKKAWEATLAQAAEQKKDLEKFLTAQWKGIRTKSLEAAGFEAFYK